MMQKGCWKVDENDEAVYIDLEEEKDEDNWTFSRWADLPDLLLEEIFSYLPMRYKYYASLVCKSWYRAFHLPNVWSDFVLGDSTLTRGRFNYYSGWQYVLDHFRTQQCLTKVGRTFRRLTLDPMLNFYNLYEFMNMLSWCIEQVRKQEGADSVGVGCGIKALKFTFPCDMSTRDETERIRLFGTGGKLLQSLKKLMGNFTKMTHLELIDLMLDSHEAQYLLDDVCDKCCTTLKCLILINTTKVNYQLLHVGVFLNIQVLKISPQNLGDDAVELMGNTTLRHLHIVQNRYTPTDTNIKPVSGRSWKICRKNNPQLAVHLELECVKDKPIIWQEYAPVRSIMYDSPHVGLQSPALMSAIDMYRKDLMAYGHKAIPRFYQQKSFGDRIDGLLFLLCQECPHINTLIITERISTATILLLAFAAKELRYLYIRKNAVILRCDWTQNPEWSEEFFKWLKFNSKSYEHTEHEVSQILGYNWRMQTDKQFKNLHVNLHAVT